MSMMKRQPTFAELAKDALEGDGDAAVQLAKRSPCKGFDSWFRRWCPADERTESFDVFSDAYARMELDKLDAQLGGKAA